MTPEERINKLKKLGWKQEIVTIERWRTRSGFVLNSDFIKTASDDQFEEVLSKMTEGEKGVWRDPDLRRQIIHKHPAQLVAGDKVLNPRTLEYVIITEATFYGGDRVKVKHTNGSFLISQDVMAQCEIYA